MFTINGNTWEIRFINATDPLLMRSDGSRTVGVTDKNFHTVFIADNIGGLFLKKVLCHEIVHCAMFSYGVYLDLKQEELVADLIATYGEEIINVTNEIFRAISKVA